MKEQRITSERYKRHAKILKKERNSQKQESMNGMKNVTENADPIVCMI